MKYTSTSTQLVIEVRAAQSPPHHQFDYSVLASPGLAAVFAVIGWVVIERFARERERRADLREMVKAFDAAVEDVVASAVVFYGLTGSEPKARSLAASIRAKLGLLPRIIAAMTDAGLTISANDELRMFRQSITSDPFDSLGRVALPDNSPLFESMSQAGQALAHEVQLSFYTHYVRKARRISFRRATKAGA